jgi:SAM-dependent methyltransferase
MVRPPHPTTWKRLLRENAESFIAWSQESGAKLRCFRRLAIGLERYLFRFVLGGGSSPEATTVCDEFLHRLPDVLGRCDEPIYDTPLAADAYAFVHLLERYRRFWRVLEEMTRAGLLPMRERGIDILDVGTGPAPALYATTDFYALLSRYAGERGISRLVTPAPQLFSIESSRGMSSLFHYLSEIAGMPGPFGTTFTDLAAFDPAAIRREQIKWRIRQISDEDDLDDKEAARWVHNNENYWQDQYRYSLCIFSNFLTQVDTVDRYSDELLSIFRALRPGGVVVLMGAVNAQYPQIYHRLAEIAAEGRVQGIKDMPSTITWDYTTPDAARIKRLYRRVWGRLANCATNVREFEAKLPSSLWNAAAPLTGPKQFAVRVFRRGEW